MCDEGGPDSDHSLSQRRSTLQRLGFLGSLDDTPETLAWKASPWVDIAHFPVRSVSLLRPLPKTLIILIYLLRAVQWELHFVFVGLEFTRNRPPASDSFLAALSSNQESLLVLFFQIPVSLFLRATFRSRYCSKRATIQMW